MQEKQTGKPEKESQIEGNAPIRNIDALAHNTTPLHKELGVLRKDQIQFYRQLRDTGESSLMLFPTHHKTRSKAQKFTRDELAFNLVILAATQSAKLNLTFKEFKKQNQTNISQQQKQKPKKQNPKKKSQKIINDEKQIDEKIGDLQIDKIVRQMQIAKIIERELQQDEEKSNGVYQNLKEIHFDLTSPFQNASLLMVTLNFIKNLLSFFASCKFKLPDLEKLGVVINFSSVEEGSVHECPQVDLMVKQINMKIGEMLRTSFTKYSGTRLRGKTENEGDRQNESISILDRKSTFISILTICPNYFDGADLVKQQQFNNILGRQKNNVLGSQEDEQNQEQINKNIFTKVKELVLTQCSPKLMNQQKLFQQKTQQIFDKFPRTKSLKLKMMRQKQRQNQVYFKFTNFTLLTKQISKYLPLLQALVAYDSINLTQGLEIILGECPYLFSLGVNITLTENREINLLREITGRIISIQMMLDTIKILKSRGYGEETIKCILERVKPLRIT